MRLSGNDLLYQWEENELFYKQLYEIQSGEKEAYAHFLEELDISYLKKHGLCVPDLFEPYKRFGEIFPIFPLDSDIAVWKHSRYTPDYVHSHKYFEIVCVMDGCITHCIDEKNTFEMHKGDICILPDQVKHAVKAEADDALVINIMIKKSRFNYLFFDFLSMDSFLSAFFRDALFDQGLEKQRDSHSNYLLFRTDEDNVVHELILLAYEEYYYHRKYFAKILQNIIGTLFAYLLREYEHYYVAGDTHPELEVIKWLRMNFMDVTLESAAKHFNYSSAYFSRLIRSYTGETFSNLIKKYKMEMACRLLEESVLPVGQICTIVGYNSPEHFNRLFKSKYGVTPTEYRMDTKNTE